MTTAEAKAMIKKEFMDGFFEWLKDEAEMPDREYSRKYGYGKGEKVHKDNLAGVKTYQKYFFQGRYRNGWIKAGYDMAAIYALHDEGFLSYEYYSNWQARQLGRTEFFYISQKTAAAIYKEYKAGA